MYFANEPIGNRDGIFTNGMSCALCDADGTGQDNLLKYLAGLNPTNPASVFQITSISRQSNAISVAWQAGGGRTDVLQAASAVNGTYSNVGSNVILTSSGDVVTNCLDVGGATNGPNRFYRIRLVP